MIEDKVDALSQIVAGGLGTAVTVDNHKGIDALSCQELGNRKTFVNRTDVLEPTARANNGKGRIRLAAEKEKSGNRLSI